MSTIEFAEVVPREEGEARTVLRREERQRPSAAGRGDAEIVEGRRDVGIALVQLILERADFAGLQNN
jgi:hypothetical protein